MTENTVPNPVPEPSDDISSNGHEAVTPDSSVNPVSEADSGWEPVNFPGQLSLGEDNSSGDRPFALEPEIEPPVASPSNSKEAQNNTNELIQLIQDLNHCNDALLNRISNLEEALERSQAALQTEIERNQGLQANGSGPMSHQVAQLLSEIDIANDGLRRVTMHNEALQAELDISQQRVAQLERECTLLQQRFNEKSTALQQAELTCRDFKSRLHRQQRYTLQFKAALEKCLNMPPNNSTAAGVSSDLSDGPGASLNPVAMPKSQHIQPWSAEEQEQRQDVNIGDLLRNLKTSSPGAGSSHLSTGGGFMSQAPASPPPERVSDPEAENLLWQDLERVTESQASPSPSALFDVPEPDPWHSPAHSQSQPSFAPGTEPTNSPEKPSFRDATPPEEPVFTEPSPWGVPLSTPEPAAASAPGSLEDATAAAAEGGAVFEETVIHQEQPRATPRPSPPPSPAPGPLPNPLQSPLKGSTASPAPLVYPLRAPQKRKSLAAVELPNFGRTSRRR